MPNSGGAFGRLPFCLLATGVGKPVSAVVSKPPLLFEAEIPALEERIRKERPGCQMGALE